MWTTLSFRCIWLLLFLFERGFEAVSTAWCCCCCCRQRRLRRRRRRCCSGLARFSSVQFVYSHSARNHIKYRFKYSCMWKTSKFYKFESFKHMSHKFFVERQNIDLNPIGLRFGFLDSGFEWGSECVCVKRNEWFTINRNSLSWIFMYVRVCAIENFAYTMMIRVCSLCEWACVCMVLRCRKMDNRLISLKSQQFDMDSFPADFQSNTVACLCSPSLALFFLGVLILSDNHFYQFFAILSPSSLFLCFYFLPLLFHTSLTAAHS